MRKEATYSTLYKKYKRLSEKKINEIIIDMQNEMDKVATRTTSEGFKLLNDSDNNLKYSVLIQILEEKSSN
jgi:hypothetical protein